MAREGEDPPSQFSPKVVTSKHLLTVQLCLGAGCIFQVSSDTSQRNGGTEELPSDKGSGDIGQELAGYECFDGGSHGRAVARAKREKEVALYFKQ